MTGTQQFILALIATGLLPAFGLWLNYRLKRFGVNIGVKMDDVKQDIAAVKVGQEAAADDRSAIKAQVADIHNTVVNSPTTEQEKQHNA